MTVDTLVALILLACIFGAALLYYLSKVYFWARGVKPYGDVAPDYVTHGGAALSRVPPFPQEQEQEQEQEPERERERAEPTPEPPALVDGKLYTHEQIAVITAQAEEHSAARALGLLLGRQLLDSEDRAVAMELLFGPRGRKHQRVRPLVDAAAAEVTPAAAEARLVPISDGREGYIEL